MSKQEIRSSVIAKRNSLDEIHISSMSFLIAARLLKLKPIKDGEKIMLYYSFVSEPKTKPLIDRFLEEGKIVALPLTIPSTRLILPMRITKHTRYIMNKFGIPEPEHDNKHKADEKKIDVVVMPGVAFDVLGNRVGFGFGYYDKFLKKLRPDCVKIALAFELQIVGKVPASENDMPVDLIVTEKRVIDCKANRDKFLPG